MLFCAALQESGIASCHQPSVNSNKQQTLPSPTFHHERLPASACQSITGLLSEQPKQHRPMSKTTAEFVRCMALPHTASPLAGSKTGSGGTPMLAATLGCVGNPRLSNFSYGTSHLFKLGMKNFAELFLYVGIAFLAALQDKAHDALSPRLYTRSWFSKAGKPNLA